MDWIIFFIKRFTIIFSGTAIVVGFLNIFEVIRNILNTHFWILFLIIGLIALISFIWECVDKRNRAHISKQKIKERIGYQQSKTTEYSDYIHTYKIIHRRDLLDYNKPKYFISIRRLKGYNSSFSNSDGIVHFEGIECKTIFSSVKIKAVDLVTGNELKIVNVSGDNEPKFFLAFKILFESTLKRGEEFDILYKITIPEELKIRSDADDFDSISLVRYRKKVDKLRFDICLSFKPLHTFTFIENFFKEAVYCKETPSRSIEYTPEDERFKELNINWSTTPYITTLEVEKPKKIVYAIHYSMDNKGK